MKNYVIDSHCDTALKIINGKGINDMYNQFTLNNSLTYDKYIQLFAMYIEPEYVVNGEYDLCLRLIESLKNEIEKNKEYINIITNKNEFEKYFNLKESKLGIILTVEDGVCLEGKIENLQNLYDNGIRVIGLTWNNDNQIASGCNSINDIGLTLFGTEVVKKMNELGMIIDVSHLSEKSFYDVIKMTKKPVIASHSCSKYLCDHKRNLTDEQIKLIADMGGVIGVNFYKDFLSNDRNKADISCVVEHIKHIYKIGGKECICIGSDYDGMNDLLVAKGLENNLKLKKLVELLKKERFTDEDVDRIMWKNQYNFFMRELM